MSSFEIEIPGKSADRFRAYHTVKLLRTPTPEDHAARAVKTGQPYPKGAKIRYNGQEPTIEGDVTGEAVSISAPEGVTITKVVFYKGLVEEETVVGSLDVNEGGEISISILEPPEAIFDEQGNSLLIVDEEEA